MGPAAVTALLSAALAGVDGTAVDLQLAGRVETSARAYAGDGVAPHQLVATDVLPRLSLALDRRTTRLSLGYEPQLRLARDLTFTESSASLAHGGWARAGWDLTPLWRTTAELRGSVRIVDLVTPTGGDVARLLALRAPATTVRVLDTGASAGIEGRPVRLLTLRSTLGVGSSGGLGAEGRAAMPRVRELHATGSVEREQTRKDVLRLELARLDAIFDAGGGTASITTVTGGWTHDAARTVRLRLAAAASAAREPDGAATIFPGGAAGLDATAALLGRPLHATAALRAGPALERFGGIVQEQLGGDASVSWAATARWSVGAMAAAGRVLESQGYSAWRGDLRTEWRATRRVALTAGAWSEWHHDPRLAAGSTTSYWGTSVAVELAPAPR